LAEFLGGEVRVVCSKPGVGTTFRLSIVTGLITDASSEEDVFAALPLQTDTDKSLDKNSQSLPVGCKILLAEDGLDNQRMIMFILKKAGAIVTVANNGRIAVDQVEAANQAGEPFDLILMDMQMPELDGYDATRHLRSQGFTQPIIALTAHAMAGDREKCVNAGCNDYLTKPISKPRLLKLLNEYLAGMMVENS
jgi:Amt family ammonium transporter